MHEGASQSAVTTLYRDGAILKWRTVDKVCTGIYICEKHYAQSSQSYSGNMNIMHALRSYSQSLPNLSFC